MTWREVQRRQKLRQIRATTSPKTKKTKTSKPPRGGTSTNR